MTTDCKFRDSVRRMGPSLVMIAAVVVLAFSLIYKAGREAGMKTARARLSRPWMQDDNDHTNTTSIPP